MNVDRDDLPTEAELDRLDADCDLDFHMCVEAELIENVEGLAGSALRWPVVDCVVDRITGRTRPLIETADGIAYLRFLLAKGGRYSWDESGYLLQLDLVESGVTFGPGQPCEVVAASFDEWQRSL